MLEIDAYEHAQTLFGTDAGVWRAAPDRVVVGRWVTIGDTSEPRVGAFTVPGPTILRTNRMGLQVLGEGPTWAKAFTAAESYRKGLGL